MAASQVEAEAELELEQKLQEAVEQVIQQEVEEELKQGAEDTKPEDEYTPVCSLSELQELGRKRVMSNGRAVVLFYLKESGNIHALDHFCYRES